MFTLHYTVMWFSLIFSSWCIYTCSYMFVYIISQMFTHTHFKFFFPTKCHSCDCMYQAFSDYKVSRGQNHTSYVHSGKSLGMRLAKHYIRVRWQIHKIQALGCGSQDFNNFIVFIGQDRHTGSRMTYFSEQFLRGIAMYACTYESLATVKLGQTH